MKNKIRLSSGFGVKRVGFIASVLMLVVYVALSLPVASYAQIDCGEKCLGELANCIQMAHGDPIAGTICQDRYDACIAACVGF